MREVEWTDRNGRRHRSIIRDNDPDEMAESGIPMDPPDIDMIDWEAVKTDLHNALLDQEIITWDDVVARQTALRSASISSLKRHLVMLYKGTRT